uniref:Uncharacterized protein n=1 Tax=Candidatus Kentrum sp. FW TaxID=2126338 RepID=A0A450SFN1_9GAMM|nr:MAG: hypothetical protein BECKFW1821A_GA0114235_103218 [Candidatus Kentron sp. FW]
MHRLTASWPLAFRNMKRGQVFPFSIMIPTKLHYLGSVKQSNREKERPDPNCVTANARMAKGKSHVGWGERSKPQQFPLLGFALAGSPQPTLPYCSPCTESRAT